MTNEYTNNQKITTNINASALHKHRIPISDCPRTALRCIAKHRLREFTSNFRIHLKWVELFDIVRYVHAGCGMYAKTSFSATTGYIAGSPKSREWPTSSHAWLLNSYPRYIANNANSRDSAGKFEKKNITVPIMHAPITIKYTAVTWLNCVADEGSNEVTHEYAGWLRSRPAIYRAGVYATRSRNKTHKRHVFAHNGVD